MCHLPRNPGPISATSSSLGHINFQYRLASFREHANAREEEFRRRRAAFKPKPPPHVESDASVVTPAQKEWADHVHRALLSEGLTLNEDDEYDVALLDSGKDVILASAQPRSGSGSGEFGKVELDHFAVRRYDCSANGAIQRYYVRHPLLGTLKPGPGEEPSPGGPVRCVVQCVPIDHGALAQKRVLVRLAVGRTEEDATLKDAFVVRSTQDVRVEVHRALHRIHLFVRVPEKIPLAVTRKARDQPESSPCFTATVSTTTSLVDALFEAVTTHDSGHPGCVLVAGMHRHVDKQHYKFIVPRTARVLEPQDTAQDGHVAPGETIVCKCSRHIRKVVELGRGRLKIDALPQRLWSYLARVDLTPGAQFRVSVLAGIELPVDGEIAWNRAMQESGSQARRRFERQARKRQRLRRFTNMSAKRWLECTNSGRVSKRRRHSGHKKKSAFSRSKSKKRTMGLHREALGRIKEDRGGGRGGVASSTAEQGFKHLLRKMSIVDDDDDEDVDNDEDDEEFFASDSDAEDIVPLNATAAPTAGPVTTTRDVAMPPMVVHVPKRSSLEPEPEPHGGASATSASSKALAPAHWVNNNPASTATTTSSFSTTNNNSSNAAASGSFSSSSLALLGLTSSKPKKRSKTRGKSSPRSRPARPFVRRTAALGDPENLAWTKQPQKAMFSRIALQLRGYAYIRTSLVLHKATPEVSDEARAFEESLAGATADATEAPLLLRLYLLPAEIFFLVCSFVCHSENDHQFDARSGKNDKVSSAGKDKGGKKRKKTANDERFREEQEHEGRMLAQEDRYVRRTISVRPVVR